MHASITVSLVVAVAENGVIGNEGGLPWRLSTDLKRFKALTIGKPVIMGRKTFESIGKPLPGRPNIVVTRDTRFAAQGVIAVGSIDHALARAAELSREANVGEICVIGGGEIYRQALDKADILHITHVLARVDGDTRFPPIDPARWGIVAQEDIPSGPRDNFPTRFVTYARRHAAANRR
ncbi:MAG TPA: dihydrofolate reductase [Rhizobiaceae bacterium]|nr:dihydrofolate reductase [Rhizobiaceae bacterium]